MYYIIMTIISQIKQNRIKDIEDMEDIKVELDFQNNKNKVLEEEIKYITKQFLNLTKDVSNLKLENKILIERLEKVEKIEKIENTNQKLTTTDFVII